MRLRHILALITLGATGTLARADMIRTFGISGSSVVYGLAGDTNTVSGSVTIDTTTGAVQGISVLAGGSYQAGVDEQQGPIVYFGASRAKISFDASTLQNYMGSAFDLNGPNDLYVGHIAATALAPTPEPGSLILLTTGLAAGLATKRRCTLGRRTFDR